MLTRKLWRALNQPGNHPVYRRTLAAKHRLRRRQHFGIWIVFVYLLLCCGLSFLWSLVSWLPLLVIAMVLLANTAYSMTWATNISSAVASERENHTYDLICLSPAGPLVASWAICKGRVHRSGAFSWVYFVVRLVSVTLIASLAIALVVPLATLASESPQVTSLGLLHTLANALAVCIIFFVDHVHSFVLGCLVGILAPTYMRPGSEARFRALATYLFWQLVGYAIPVLTALLILPVFYQVFRVSGWFSGISQAFLGVAIFALVREAITRQVWKRLTDQLNVDSAELDFVTTLTL